MSKELSVKINDELFKKLDNPEMKKRDVITKALHQFFENKEQNNETVTTLKENVQALEKQRESLEIDYTGLMQENKNLQTRIDDLAKMYPSAVVLLGKTSESRLLRRNRWSFKK
ncbi:MAG: hypothetical protein KAH91_03270 [Thermoplasmatales archaeon]|nr:hypothetical protein [Thermoplasmatales archaeon]